MESISKIKDEYQNQKALQEFGSETVKDCLRELDSELDTHGVKGGQGTKADVVKQNSIISNLVKQIAEIDKMTQTATAQLEGIRKKEIPSWMTKGSSSLNSTRASMNTSFTSTIEVGEDKISPSIIRDKARDLEEITQQLYDSLEEDVSTLEDLSRAIIMGYKGTKFGDLDPSIIKYYSDKVKRLKKPLNHQPMLTFAKPRVFFPLEYEGKKIHSEVLECLNGLEKTIMLEAPDELLIE